MHTTSLHEINYSLREGETVDSAKQNKISFIQRSICTRSKVRMRQELQLHNKFAANTKLQHKTFKTGNLRCKFCSTWEETFQELHHPIINPPITDTDESYGKHLQLFSFFFSQ